MKHPTLTLYNEQWLFRKLREHGCGFLGEGLTTADERREIARKAILENNLTAVIVGRGKDGKTELYPELFKRLYGEPLVSAAQENAA